VHPGLNIFLKQLQSEDAPHLGYNLYSPKGIFMPRIKLKPLGSYEYCHPLRVRATDINYGGHLGNEALLELIHEARAHFLGQLGFDTFAAKDKAVGMIMADLAVNYIAEAYAQDALEIDSQIDEMRRKSFRLFHRVRRADQVIALVETGLLAFDYLARVVVPLPEDFLVALEKFRSERRGAFNEESQSP
jgi:acyl-CoA thioester hydrolase